MASTGKYGNMLQKNPVPLLISLAALFMLIVAGFLHFQNSVAGPPLRVSQRSQTSFDLRKNSYFFLNSYLDFCGQENSGRLAPLDTSAVDQKFTKFTEQRSSEERRALRDIVGQPYSLVVPNEMVGKMVDKLPGDTELFRVVDPANSVWIRGFTVDGRSLLKATDGAGQY